MLTFGSAFAGIGGLDLGLERAGWECKWQIENDRFCNKILKKRWPSIKRYGDVEAVKTEELETVDLLCGGFPCQDLSVAGKRRGLSGERSGLFWELVRLVRGLRPRWLLVENVPGFLSSNEGRDFAVAIETLAECGYGLAWRVLDSQYFGVPQRRRRVFIVGHLGAICPPEILFEPEGGEGDIAEGGKAGKGLAAETERSIVDALQARDYKGVGTQYVQEGKLIIEDSPNTEFGSYAQGPDRTFIGEEADPEGVREASGVPRRVDLFVSENQRAEMRLTPYARQLTSGGGKPGQGYPAVLTQTIEGMACPCPDSPRYRALGNAVTVQVAEWIGRRIIEYEPI